MVEMATILHLFGAIMTFIFQPWQFYFLILAG